MKELNFKWTKNLPVVLQSEAAECGLACICMILSFHGFYTDLGVLRRRFYTSIKGMSLSDLMNITQSLKMTGTVSI